MSLNRYDDMICGVCACRATGLGYAPPKAKPGAIIWLCDDPDCIPIAQRSYAMKQDEFTRIERLAAMAGGDAVEQFCHDIGKSDLSQFSQGEFEEFCLRMVGEYRSALRNKLQDEAPF